MDIRKGTQLSYLQTPHLMDYGFQQTLASSPRVIKDMVDSKRSSEFRFDGKSWDFSSDSRHFHQGSSMNSNTVLTQAQKLNPTSSSFSGIQGDNLSLSMRTNLSQLKQSYPILYSKLVSSTDFNSSTDRNINPLTGFNKTTSAFSEETNLNHDLHAITPSLGQQCSALSKLIILCDGQFTANPLPQMTALNNNCLNSKGVAALPRQFPNSVSQETNHANEGVSPLVVGAFSEIKLDELMDSCLLVGDIGTVLPAKHQVEMERVGEESHNSLYQLKISVLSAEEARRLFYENQSDSNPQTELETGASPYENNLEVRASLPKGQEVTKVRSLNHEDNTEYPQAKLHSGLSGNENQEHLLISENQHCNWKENPQNKFMISYNGNGAHDPTSLFTSQQKQQSNIVNVTERLDNKAESNNSLCLQPALSTQFFESSCQWRTLSGHKNDKLYPSTICRDPKYEDLTDDEEDSQIYLATDQINEFISSLSNSNSPKHEPTSTNQDNDQILSLRMITSNNQELSSTEKDTLKQSYQFPYFAVPLNGFDTRLCSTYETGTERVEKIKDSTSYLSSHATKSHVNNPVLISSLGFCTLSSDTPLTSNQKDMEESEHKEETRPGTICTDSKYQDITDNDGNQQNNLISSSDKNQKQVLSSGNQENGDRLVPAQITANNQALSMDSLAQICHCPYYIETLDGFEERLCPACETGIKSGKKAKEFISNISGFVREGLNDSVSLNLDNTTEFPYQTDAKEHSHESVKGEKSGCITETEASLHENLSEHREVIKHEELMEYQSLPEETPWIENKTFQSGTETSDSDDDDDDDDDDWMVVSVALSDVTFKATDGNHVSPHNVFLQDTEDEGTQQQVGISCSIGSLSPSSPSSDLDVFESFATFIKAKNVKSVHYISEADKPEMAPCETKSEYGQASNTLPTKGQSSTSDTENSSDYSISSPKSNYLTVSSHLWKETSGDFSKFNSTCKKRRLQTSSENNNHSIKSDNRRRSRKSSESIICSNSPRCKSKSQKISNQNEDVASTESDSEAEQYRDRKWKELRKEQRVKRIADKERRDFRKKDNWEGGEWMKQKENEKQLDMRDEQKQGENYAEISKSPPKKRKKDSSHQKSKAVKRQQKATLGERPSTMKDNGPSGRHLYTLRQGSTEGEHGFKSFEDQSISRVHPISSRKSVSRSKEDSLSSGELLTNVSKVVSTTSETLTSTRQCLPSSREESLSSSRKNVSKSRKGTKEGSLTAREIISNVRESSSSKGLPSARRCLSDPREASLSSRELLSKSKQGQFNSISSGKHESKYRQLSSSSKSLLTAIKSPSTSREGLSSKEGSAASLQVSQPSLPKSREGSSRSKGFPSSSRECPSISAHSPSTPGEGFFSNSGTVRGVNQANQKVVTEKQSRIPSTSKNRHLDAKDKHRPGSRQDKAPRQRDKSQDSAAPLMKRSLTQAIDLIKATYREAPRECEGHVSTSRHDSSMREHLPEPLGVQSPVVYGPPSSRQSGSDIRESLPFSGEVSSTSKETLFLSKRCLLKSREHLSFSKENVSKSRKGLSKEGSMTLSESISNPRESSSSKCSPPVRKCLADSRKASASLKDIFSKSKEGQSISRRCLGSSSERGSDSREQLSSSKSLLKSREDPYSSRKVLSSSKHLLEMSEEGTTLARKGPSSYMSKSREASSTPKGVPSSYRECPSTSGDVPSTSKDFTWNKDTTRGISRANSPTASMYRHHDAEREPRTGPRQDKAPRRRHNSQESVAPLMKKSFTQAMHLTKTTQQDSPQKYAQGLKDGYKWAEKKPCENRTASERRCSWDFPQGHRSK